MQIDITELVKSLILIFFYLIGYYVVPLIKERRLQGWVRVAVNAAEMIFAGDGRGAEKKTYVLDFINAKLKSIHMKLDTESMENMIEAEVLKLNKRLDE